MFPAYECNHSYPQSRPQTECRHHPISEGIPPQMKMEGSNIPPFMYQSWPPHHFGYPVPTQCHSCCNHNNPYPSYYPYRPPYPHFPSPPQCYGAYPVYPEPYPFHYAPPPHYTMEIPKYEYDKSMPGNFHCCGCSHPKTVNTSGDKGVKIEEHEPDAENQEDSMVPAGYKTLPKQPIMWVPPEYMKNQEHVSGAKPRDQPNGWHPLDYETIKRILESIDGGRLQDQRNKRLIKSREKEDVGHQENVGQEPKSWSRMMPLDVDSLKKMLQQNESLRKDHDDQGRNPSHESPFPIIWLPYNSEENGQIGNKEAANCALESSAQKECEGDDHSQKVGPVKKTEGDAEEKLSVEKSEKSLRTIPVKYLDETSDVKAKSIEDSKKSTEKVTKSKPSTSSAKATKLPPICLRVDPLPKKKNGQGKSRSPSPPGDGVKQVNSVKPSSVSGNKAKGIENEPDKKSMEEPQPKTEENDVVVEKPAKLAVDENEGKDVGERPKSKEVEVKKKILSGTEAATIIQSAYRGYEVRRWEPLKKMRQIASIEEEADALKRRIESGAGSMDLKQKVAVGETIMSLLLKLDTIQGLHSSVRDVRKHVAKKLVSLQEMLDTIVLKQPENESSSPEISEAEAKGGETQLQTRDESFLSSGLSAAGDQGVEETKDHISSSHKVSHVEESCSVPESLSGEMAHDQAIPEETDIKNLADMPEEAHELSQESEECPSANTAVDVSMDEASIKSVDQEPAPRVSEAHSDSTDEADMSHDLLAELPVAILEESAIQDQHEPEPSEPSNGKVLQEAHVEVSESPGIIDEPEKLQEFDETLKVEIPIVQQDAESPENAETELEPKTVKNPIEQGVESVVPEENNVPEHNYGNADPNLTEPMKVIECHEEMITKNPIENEADHEVGAKPCEEDVKLENSSAEDNVKEENEKMRSLVEKLTASGKEQQQVICSLNEKLKELEGKLAKEKKKKGSRARKARVLRPRSCGVSAKGFCKQGQVSLAS